ncbi:hypothetical protein [Azospirillum sp. sgz301742]
MANWFDDFSDNLLGSYRGKPIDPMDPTAIDRLGALSDAREEELRRQSLIAQQARQQQLLAAALANKYASAGGILTHSLPDPKPYMSTVSDWANRETDISKTRISGNEKDEDRIARFVADSYKSAVDRDKEDWTRSKWEQEFDYRKGRDAVSDSHWNSEFGLRKEADARSATKFGWDAEDRLKKEKFGLLEGKAVYQDPVTGEFRWLDDHAPVEPGKYKDIKGMVLDDGKSRYQSELNYIDPVTGKRFNKVFDPKSGTAVIKDSTGAVLADAEVEKRLQPDSVSAPTYAGLGAFSREQGKTGSEGLNKLAEAAAGAANTKQVLDTLEKTLANQSTGVLTDSDTLRGLASAVQQVTGVSLPNFDPTKQDVALQQIGDLLLSQRERLKGQGAITDYEQRTLERTLPSLGKSPEANRQIIEILRNAADRTLQKRDAWMSDREAGKVKPEDFNNWSMEYQMRQSRNPAAAPSSSSRPTASPSGLGGAGREQALQKLYDDVKSGRLSKEQGQRIYDEIMRGGY